MEVRRKSREVALQVLFQNHFQQPQDLDILLEIFKKNFFIEDKTSEYAFYLTHSIMEKKDLIDDIIEKYSDNWRIDRMSLIDHILLQIVTLELCFPAPPSTDPKLCMTDIIDLAKKYSSKNSKAFINGIMDQIYHNESKKHNSK